MRGSLLLSDAASVHPDNTFSVLRGGINLIAGEKAPFRFQGAMLVRLRIEAGDEKKHTAVIRCTDEKGQSTIGDLEAEFTAERVGLLQFMVQIRIDFQAKGKFTFRLLVDGKEHDDWPVEVEEKKS